MYLNVGNTLIHPGPNKTGQMQVLDPASWDLLLFAESFNSIHSSSTEYCMEHILYIQPHLAPLDESGDHQYWIFYVLNTIPINEWNSRPVFSYFSEAIPN